MADTLIRLISINPDTPTTPEEPGYEFGYAIFEEFPKVMTHTYEVNEVVVGMKTEIFKNDPALQEPLQSIENPIAPQRLQVLQKQDTNIKILKRKLCNNRLDKVYYSLDENELLTMKVIDGGHKFHAIYLPSVLIFQVLRTAHDDLGHNGFPRTYAAVKRVFFWKGMKEDIRKHCKTCATCQLHKLENVKFKRKIFKPSLQPMDFICMDLIGEFHPPTSCGHCYALTAVCMLKGFTWKWRKHTWTTFIAVLEAVSKYSWTMEQNSRINCSRRSSVNLVRNFLFIHLLTGPKVMAKLKDFTGS